MTSRRSFFKSMVRGAAGVVAASMIPFLSKQMPLDQCLSEEPGEYEKAFVYAFFFGKSDFESGKSRFDPDSKIILVDPLVVGVKGQL